MVEDGFDESALTDALGKILGTMEKRTIIQETKPLWSMTIVLSMIIVLGSILWYSYPREAKYQEFAAAPVIRADARPYRIAPDDPGGMNIPYRDSTIFDTLQARREEGDERRIEKLLPEDETPLPREQLFAGLFEDITEEIVEKKADTEPVVVAPAVVAPVITAPAVVASSVVPAPLGKPEIAVKMAATEPAAGTTEYATHYVQLGSLTSQVAAAREWEKLQGQFTELKILDHRIQKADLGAQGTYYRVQAGPVGEGYARLLCTIVTAKRPGTCLVIRN